MKSKVTPNEYSTAHIAFHTLVAGVFIHNPWFQLETLGNLTEDTIYSRYGNSFQTGLTTFSRLSPAEQSYLVNYLQK